MDSNGQKRFQNIHKNQNTSEIKFQCICSTLFAYFPKTILGTFSLFELETFVCLGDTFIKYSVAHIH